MALDMFLKLSGITGEAKDAVHKGELDVLNWDWGASQSGSTHVGGGGGAGKVHVQDLRFAKYVDKATPDLQLACMNGKHFAEAVLTVRKAGEKPLEYLKLVMNEVLITSLTTGGGGSERITEHLALSFAQFRLEYVAQKKDGSSDGNFSTGWSIAENAKL